MNDSTPQFRVQLTHPSSTADEAEGRRAVLRVHEEVSSQVVFELELTSSDLHDLLSQRWADAATRRLGRHPERWGHEMRITSATYAHPADAELARKELEAQGWQVDEVRRNNSFRFVVTGRRWDGASE